MKYAFAICSKYNKYLLHCYDSIKAIKHNLNFKKINTSQIYEDKCVNLWNIV